MVDLGNYNELEIAREVDFGMYLTSEDGDILLPSKYIPEGAKVGDFIRVFVYRDSEDRVIATNLKPYATVREFACLTVKDVTPHGAFLDWGLEKDLLVPLHNQHDKMLKGHKYCVYIYLDDTTDRVVATTKFSKYLQNENIDLKEGQEVQLMVATQTDLGFNVVIDGKYKGLLYRNEVFQNLQVGDQVTGYIKTIRPDNKIDVSLQKPEADTFSQMDEAAGKIMEQLKQRGGTLYLTDSSNPDEIYSMLSISKKMFKRGIGSLYKAGYIALHPDHIEQLKDK
jgi:uncharacterized protein